MVVAGRAKVVPLERRLQCAQELKARSFASLRLTVVSALKRGWWHTRSYLPIVTILLLAAGSLLVLHVHWLARRLLKISASEKEAIKDMG